MATTTKRHGDELGALRSKAALFDELVERLAQAEDEAQRLSEEANELREVRRAAARDGVDPAWRELANDLAGALRPYSMFREQAVEDGRIVVHTHVAGSTLHAARHALDRLARQVAVESYREHGIPVSEDEQRAESEIVRDAA